MNELSPTARKALRQLEAAHQLGDENRDGVWSRLEASIARGDADPGGRTDALLADPDEAPPATAVPRWMWAVAGLAAAALLVWAVGHISGETVSQAQSRTPEVAPYGAEPTETHGTVQTVERREESPGRRVVVPAPVPPPVPEPETHPDAEAVATAAPRPRPPRPARAARPKTPETKLAAEMQLLRRARAAIDEGAPDRALSRLAEHEREFPNGQLAEDRLALRIIALCEGGRAAQARGEAHRFGERYPSSHHRGRIDDCLNKK